MAEPLHPTVAVVDYGVGNLFSVQHACAAVGLDAVVTDDAKAIVHADAVILPGVGAFGAAMDALRSLDLVQPIRDAAAAGTPLVGICLGMQLFMSGSEEFGGHEGFGFFPGPVVRFPPQEGPAGLLKVPQIGWKPINPPSGLGHAEDAVPPDPAHPWVAWPLSGVPSGEFMYFVHSYFARPDDPTAVLTVSPYGATTFCSSVSRDNIFACQFHPERSGPAGLAIYRNIARHVRQTLSLQERPIA